MLNDLKGVNELTNGFVVGVHWWGPRQRYQHGLHHPQHPVQAGLCPGTTINR